MTHEEAKKWEKEIKAFIDGATTQVYHMNWEDINDPGWEINNDYRIKPQSKLVPFEPSEILCGKVVRLKSDHTVLHVIRDQDSSYIYIGTEFMTHENLLNSYEFADGSPFGKEVTE